MNYPTAKDYWVIHAFQTASKKFSVLKKFGKKIGHGAIVCFVEKDIPLSREVTAIPVGYL